jgi:hypothetical protein
VDDLMTSQIRIRLGEYDFSVSSEKYPHTEKGVTKKVRKHAITKMLESD